MKVLRNEKGSLLVYALFLILLISVITVPLLQMSSTRAMSDARAKNQKIATNLAVSAVEEYLRYLGDCGSPCTDYTRYKTRYFLNGLSNSPQAIKLTLADGTPVTFSMYYQDIGNQQFNIITRVVAGDLNSDNIANEKLAGMKEIVYQVDATIHQSKIINPNDRVTAPKNQIIVNDMNQNTESKLPPKINIQQLEAIKAEITDYLGNLSKNTTEQKQNYLADAITYNTKCRAWDDTCKINDINKLIQNNPSPVIIYANSLTIEKGNLTFGSSSKEVVLIVDSLTLNNNVSINIYGNLITHNLTANNKFDFNTGINPLIYPNTNLWVTGTAIFNNSTTLSVGHTVYANKLTANNTIDVNANQIIVNNQIELNNNSILDAKTDIVAGNLRVNNNADIYCTAGDLLIQNDMIINNNLELNVGGTVAVAGTLTINGSPKLFETGGVKDASSVHLDQEGTSEGQVVWMPTRG